MSDVFHVEYLGPEVEQNQSSTSRSFGFDKHQPHAAIDKPIAIPALKKNLSEFTVQMANMLASMATRTDAGFGLDEVRFDVAIDREDNIVIVGSSSPSPSITMIFRRR